MDIQTTYKYDWVIKTLSLWSSNYSTSTSTSNQKEIVMDAETIKAVFNIPLKDARLILNHFTKQ
jgi:hypothetical protein